MLGLGLGISLTTTKDRIVEYTWDDLTTWDAWTSWVVWQK